MTHANTTKKLVPHLRFPEFSGEWERKSLDKYINLISGYAFKGDEISEDNTGIPILRGINITEGRIRHNEKIDRFYTGDFTKLEKYRLKVNDLVLGMDGSKVGKNVALIEEEDSESLLVQRVARIRAKSEADIRYIYHNIFSSKFHRYVDVVNTSSGIPHISSKQIRDFKIGFPQLPEQQKIANFLSLVDKKISLLQQQHAALETYKKGLLQQLFPSTTSTGSVSEALKPALRFKDDNGNNFPDWEEKRLGEIAEFIGGGTPSTAKGDFWNGTIQWFTPTEIKQKYVENSERTITELGLKNSSAKLLPKGTILLTTRATIGEVSIATKECSTNQGFQSLIVNDYVNNIFIYNWIKKNKHQLLKRANGSTFSEISKGEIQKIKISLPCLDEQTKIADFLSKVDERIAIVHQQISKTQQFKKGLLQQLFV